MRMMMVIGLALVAVAQAKPELSPELRSTVESAVERQDIRAAVVGLYEDGASRIVGFGRIGPANESRPDGNTAFEIGSITKVFTALLAQAQVDAGRLDWDAPLSRYLEEVDFASDAVAAITLRELATHTSGLPRLPGNLDPEEPLDPYGSYGRDELLNWLAAWQPGELKKEYAYSNLGFGLLGLIAADAAGLDYAAALERDVLHPLGLSDTGVGTADVPEGRLARGFSDGADMPNWTFEALAGAGAVVSTASDLLEFIRLNLEAEEGMLAAIQEPQPNGKTALGWHLQPVGDGGTIYWHNGGTGGYSAFLGFRPATETGLVILTASTEAQRITELGLAQIAGRTLDAGTNLDPYPGTYRLGEGFTLTVFVEGGRLFAQATGQGAFPLTPSGTDAFEFPPADIRIRFARKGDGPAHELTLVQGGRTTVAPRVSDETPTRAYRAIEVEPSVLRDYEGRYLLAPEVIVTVEARGDQLYAQVTGQAAYPVFPYDEDRFFFKVVDAQLEFERGEDGTVTGLVLHQAGSRSAPRID